MLEPVRRNQRHDLGFCAGSDWCDTRDPRSRVGQSKQVQFVLSMLLLMEADRSVSVSLLAPALKGHAWVSVVHGQIEGVVQHDGWGVAIGVHCEE
jgi:hypothetical protein